jgi:hypothetical protein
MGILSGQGARHHGHGSIADTERWQSGGGSGGAVIDRPEFISSSGCLLNRFNRAGLAAPWSARAQLQAYFRANLGFLVL